MWPVILHISGTFIGFGRFAGPNPR